MTLQEKIISELGVNPTINPQSEIKKRIGFLKEYLKKSSTKGYVLGISGGQDSTLAGKIVQLAINELKEESYECEFYAVRLPYGSQTDEDDAQKAIEFIQPNHILTYNIMNPILSFDADFKNTTGEYLTDFTKGNTKARMRMMVQYAIAGEKNLLVVGTDHAAEAVTGFFTKYGDGAADILPLSGLNKRQGRFILKELEAPESLYNKAPTADLLDDKPAQSDEVELGITYKEIDDYLEGKEINIKAKEKIEGLYLKTIHKRILPVPLPN